MKRENVIFALGLILVFIACASEKSQTNPDMENKSSLYEKFIIIELEELSPGNGWIVETKFPGYSGSGYIRWDGADNFQTPGPGLMFTTIDIKKPGTFRFQWHSKIGHGSNSTESNDTWLRFPDATDFYGKRTRDGNTTFVYPHGSGKKPEPHGAGSDGWFKVYSSGTTDWTWGCYVSDNDAHPIYVDFEKAGEYLMQISGRSKHHLVDRIALYHDSISEANALVLLQGKN